MTRIHAELGVIPIGTPSPSLGKYIAAGIKSLEKMGGIRYQVTPMGTIIESDDLDKIFNASKAVINSIFAMDVKRIETIIKIDERRDKDHGFEDKLKSIEKLS